MRVANLTLACCAAAALAGPPAAIAAGSAGGGSGSSGPGSTSGTTTSSTTSSGGSAISGGAGVAPGPPPPSTPLHPVVQGFTAKIVHGLAYAPSEAPIQVQKAIWAGDAIRHKPYIYAGGHASWNSPGYDCSGSVSYVLHAAGLIKTSMDSGQMMTWGVPGAGAWITVYTNPGHAFIEIAGIRLDTSAEQDPNPPSGTGPRWRPLMTSTSGYLARHPVGF